MTSRTLLDRGRPALRWVRAHPVLTALLLILAWFLVEVATIPWLSVPGLRTTNPETTALMRQRLEEADDRGESLTIRHSWVPYRRIPRHLIDAVVVAEDGTFFQHEGFDWFEVRESIEKNIRERRAARGGSTITQQLAKNLYLSTTKSPLRKAKEAVITMLLEHYLSKDRILEIYLNVIEWGKGVFGVDAAARTFFGKSAAALSFEESLRLAAVIPSPLRHRPDANSRYVMRRKETIRRRMVSGRYVPFDPDDEAEERPPVAPSAMPSATPSATPSAGEAPEEQSGEPVDARGPPADTSGSVDIPDTTSGGGGGP